VRYTGEGAPERLDASKAFAKLADAEREKVAGAVASLAGLSTTDPREAVVAAAEVNGKPSKAGEKALLEALAVRDPDASPVAGTGGASEPDPELRDQENVPLPPRPVTFEPDPSERLASEPYRRAVEQYVEADVLPYAPDSWVDHGKTKIGYEIPLTRHFYKYVPPRPLEEIDAEIRALEAEIQELVGEVTT